MSLITPHLYLGDMGSAQDYKFLTNKRVKLIVNCAIELPNFYPEHFEYIRLNWDDIPEQEIKQDLDKISNKIIEKIKSGGVVFVHCAAGISRSSSVVIYTIMKLHDWDYKKSHQFVKDFRSIINPNPGFVKQLQSKPPTTTQPKTPKSKSIQIPQPQIKSYDYHQDYPIKRTKHPQLQNNDPQPHNNNNPPQPQNNNPQNEKVNIVRENDIEIGKPWSSLTFDCPDCDLPSFVSTKSVRQGRGIYARVFS